MWTAIRRTSSLVILKSRLAFAEPSGGKIVANRWIRVKETASVAPRPLPGISRAKSRGRSSRFHAGSACFHFSRARSAFSPAPAGAVKNRRLRGLSAREIQKPTPWAFKFRTPVGVQMKRRIIICPLGQSEFPGFRREISSPGGEISSAPRREVLSGCAGKR